MFTVSALSLLLRSVESNQRGRASGLFQGGFLLGAIAGPTLGGFASEVSIRLPFFLYAGTLVVAGTIALTMLRREPPRAAVDLAARTARVTLREALARREFRAAMMANFADQWTVLGVRLVLIPLFVHESLHRSGIWIGIGFAVVSAVNAAVLLPAGMFADRAGRKPVMVSGCLRRGRCDGNPRHGTVARRLPDRDGRARPGLRPARRGPVCRRRATSSEVVAAPPLRRTRWPATLALSSDRS